VPDDATAYAGPQPSRCADSDDDGGGPLPGPLCVQPGGWTAYAAALVLR